MFYFSSQWSSWITGTTACCTSLASLRYRINSISYHRWRFLWNCEVRIASTVLYGLFTLLDSDSDSKPNGYIVLRRSFHIGSDPDPGLDPDPDPYSDSFPNGYCTHFRDGCLFQGQISIPILLYFNQVIRVWIRTNDKFLNNTVIRVWVWVWIQIRVQQWK